MLQSASRVPTLDHPPEGQENTFDSDSSTKYNYSITIDKTKKRRMESQCLNNDSGIVNPRGIHV